MSPRPSAPSSPAHRQEVVDQLDKVAAMLQPNFPAVARCWPTPAGPDRLRVFPPAHWVKIWSTNPLDGQQGDQAPTNVVGIFPDDAAVSRLAGAVLIRPMTSADRRAALPIRRLDG